MYYRELIVWQKSMRLARETYRLVLSLPKYETYSICDQMRRAAVSVPSNIAEGNERESAKDYVRFLCIAKGSLAELETQLLLCADIGYLKESQILPLLNLSTEIKNMLNAIIVKLKSRT